MLLCTNHYHLIYNIVWNSKMDASSSQRPCSYGLCLKLYRTKLTYRFCFVTFASLCSTDSMISDMEMQGLAPFWTQSGWLSENTTRNIHLFPCEWSSEWTQSQLLLALKLKSLEIAREFKENVSVSQEITDLGPTTEMR